MKNKIFFLLSAVLCTVTMSGCDDIMNYLYPQGKDKNPAYMSVYDSAEIEMNFLLDAIKRNDALAIKNEFSAYAKENIPDLDEKVKRFIDEFPLCEEYEISACSEGHNSYGKKEDAYTPHYDFTVNGKEYRLLLVYFVNSDFDETKMGWHLIQLYERSDPDNSPEMYLHGYKDDPDILLWDYTRE